MYASPKWYHFCSGVCNVSKANILSYGLEIMMFWLCNNGGDGTDPISAGVAGVGLMRHMICW
jgi:hypothetical protein